MDEPILKKLDLSTEESRDIIELSARKRNVGNYERMTDEGLLSNVKKTPQKQTNNNKLYQKIKKEEKLSGQNLKNWAINF